MKTLTIIFASLAILSSATAQKKVVCYWAAEISASQINPQICTHIIYSFLGVTSNGGITHLHRSEGQARDLIRQLVGLKSKNRNLKVLAAVGGYNDALVPVWSALAGSSSARANFANNILTFIRNNNLDGIDIDWEYPNFNTQNNSPDKNNFNLLLKDLKQRLGSAYSLSAAIGAGDWRSGYSYDIPTIFATCDFVNLMSYDLHGGWEGKTGIHAALYKSSRDNTGSNVDYSVKFLLNKGVPKNKLIVGIPAYGQAFKLANPNNNGIGAPASGAGSPKFNEICQKVKSRQLEYRWDNDQKVPYAFKGTEWVGYDDVKSVTEKANYIKNLGVGGAMIWALDSDDFRNVCGLGNFPLISAIYKIVVGGGSAAPQPNTPGKNFACPAAYGYFKHPSDCTKYYQCDRNVPILNSCGSMYYNPVYQGCDWPQNVRC